MALAMNMPYLMMSSFSFEIGQGVFVPHRHIFEQDGLDRPTVQIDLDGLTLLDVGQSRRNVILGIEQNSFPWHLRPPLAMVNSVREEYIMSAK